MKLVLKSWLAVYPTATWLSNPLLNIHRKIFQHISLFYQYGPCNKTRQMDISCLIMVSNNKIAAGHKAVIYFVSNHLQKKRWKFWPQLVTHVPIEGWCCVLPITSMM